MNLSERCAWKISIGSIRSRVPKTSTSSTLASVRRFNYSGESLRCATYDEWQRCCNGVSRNGRMRIKIHRGTPQHDEDNLCTTCQHSQIIRGRALDEEVLLCGARHDVSVRITFKVTECSAYDDARLPSYWSMLQQAWILVPGSRKRPSGFVRASDLRDDEFARYLANINRSHERG